MGSFAQDMAIILVAIHVNKWMTLRFDKIPSLKPAFAKTVRLPPQMQVLFRMVHLH